MCRFRRVSALMGTSGGRYAPGVLYAAVGTLCLWGGGPPDGQAAARLPDAAPVRAVRVRLTTSKSRVRLKADGGLIIADDTGGSYGSIPPDAWVVVTGRSSGLLVGDRACDSAALVVQPRAGDSLWVGVEQAGGWRDATEYAGRIHVVRADDGLTLINELDVERYVAAVVAAEAWPTFATEALRAQAVVSRTFVLYQMQRRQSAAYDLIAGQGAQVYRGMRKDRFGSKARQAVAYTRGIVCTWRKDGEDRLFATYYSAVCGGMSQSARIFGEADDIPPLAGGVACDYCRIAPGDTYRWGPVRLPANEVLARLSLRYDGVESLGTLTGIQVVERTPSGRPVSLRLIGSTGEKRDILAERFRLAIGAETMRSTDCSIRVASGELIIEDGHGYGHGVGLCQWGMQGQAAKGERAGEIIRYYYPGVRLKRAY